MNALLAAQLARAEGLVTTSAAALVGVTPRQLEGLVARGELERMHRGVYRSTTMHVTQRQRLLAGLLAAGSDAVVSHRAALAAHQAPNFSCSLVELTTRSTSLPAHGGMVVHRSSTLGPADVERVDQMWVTTKERSLIDGCSVLPASLMVRFAEQWLSSRAMRLDDVHRAISRLRPNPGAVALAHALDARELGHIVTDSAPEHRLGEMLVRADLAADHHVLVTTPSGYTYELDWAYPDALIGLEVDGYGIHMRSVGAFDDDRFRRNELEIAGWQILNFTDRQLRRQPGRVVQQVRGALARRETHRHGA